MAIASKGLADGGTEMDYTDEDYALDAALDAAMEALYEERFYDGGCEDDAFGF